MFYGRRSCCCVSKSMQFVKCGSNNQILGRERCRVKVFKDVVEYAIHAK